ncbi:hypothetical protein IVB38_18450 [Bradyrhizobium sp. 38]|uniref:hypothetical protein n=1 Tax=unclassified Bradyrhizobium TaxID=2631580 RepID=UPI001FFC11A0|nr:MULTISPECIES: hypothetical protein [unclassified Bradyrhizobium]MCK1337946.1 hypothetical protein [Bradyrhizobium sp. 38]MCK1780414.1 hypothetical protein [Bradyrhizobium sp. 132]
MQMTRANCFPQGYKYTVVIISNTKRVLPEDPPLEFKLKFLIISTPASNPNDAWLTAEVIAAIDPMCDHGQEMVREAAKLDKGKLGRPGMLDALAKFFQRLRSSIIASSRRSADPRIGEIEMTTSSREASHRANITSESTRQNALAAAKAAFDGTPAAYPTYTAAVKAADVAHCRRPLPAPRRTVSMAHRGPYMISRAHGFESSVVVMTPCIRDGCSPRRGALIVRGPAAPQQPDQG